MSSQGILDPQTIQAMADRLAESFNPDKIILFGSYAYGTHHEDSNMELLIAAPEMLEDYCSTHAKIMGANHRVVNQQVDVLLKTRAKAVQEFEVYELVSCPASGDENNIYEPSSCLTYLSTEGVSQHV
jgi:predicted nucleotidyltransferase